MRFRDFLRTAVLLFGGAATALAAIAVVGAGRNDDRTLVFVALGWWLLAAVSGLWMGRGATTTEGIKNLLADARSTNQLPELEPGVAIFNRHVAAGRGGGGRRSARHLLPAGAGGGGGVRHARGAAVAKAVARRGGDRGTRRRGVLARPELALRAAASCCACRGCGRSSRTTQRPVRVP